MKFFKSSKKWLTVAGLSLTLMACQPTPQVVVQQQPDPNAPLAYNNAYLPPQNNSDDWLWLYYMSQNNPGLNSYYYNNPYSSRYVRRYYSGPPVTYNYYYSRHAPRSRDYTYIPPSSSYGYHGYGYHNYTSSSSSIPSSSNFHKYGGTGGSISNRSTSTFSSSGPSNMNAYHYAWGGNHTTSSDSGSSTFGSHSYGHPSSSYGGGYHSYGGGSSYHSYGGGGHSFGHR